MESKFMDKLSYGVYILTSRHNGKDNGCIINSVIQVTSDPNRIAFAVNKKNLTHDFVYASEEFNISVLSVNSKFSTYTHWGMTTGKNNDKMEDIIFERSANGIIYIAEETNAFLSGSITRKINMDTHTLFIANVTDGNILSKDDSATYSYYQNKIKPEQKNKERKKGFICTVCGYIYESETLPDDFICPVCGHSSEVFVPL